MSLNVKKLAPIVLFVYARPEHTKRTVKALQANKYASESDLYVFSDSAKSLDKQCLVDEVRSYISTLSGFKSITICCREYNYGLSGNIIDGVTKICSLHDKVIVLEDDIITSQHFLGFMNWSLEIYSDREELWHVSGWSYPISTQGLDNTFFWRLMNCWGWGTWSSKWCHFEKNPDKLISLFEEHQVEQFNLGGAHDFWRQVTSNAAGEIDTWAIFWYATIFQNNGLCLNPSRSYVHNIGLDGSGQNCGNDAYFNVYDLNNDSEWMPDYDMNEKKVAVQRIIKYYRWKDSFIRRGINFFWRSIFGKNILE